jgi:peptide/nickel transport system permease protein
MKDIAKAILKSPTGLFGVVVIVFFALLAFPGYLITPDSTSQANNIHVEVALQKPGSKILFFKQRKNEVKEVSWLSKWINGTPVYFEEIAVQKWELKDDHIYIEEFNGDDEVAGPEHIISLGKLGFEKGVSKEEIESKFFELRKYRLGTDGFGRDLLSRVVIGGRISLSVGFIAVFISLTIGIILGMLAGYYGGKLDAAIMWLINVMWSLPTLLLVVAISFVLGKGFWQIFVAVGLSMWVDIARIIRGQVMSVKEKEFISAAKVLGLPSRRIMFGHILPNIKGPIIVIAAANFAAAILLEAGLSFLGLGVSPPTPSWGMMVNEHYSNIVFSSAFLAIIPGLAIMLLVMAFNLLGNSLRDALDVNM